MFRRDVSLMQNIHGPSEGNSVPRQLVFKHAGGDFRRLINEDVLAVARIGGGQNTGDYHGSRSRN